MYVCKTIRNLKVMLLWNLGIKSKQVHSAVSLLGPAVAFADPVRVTSCAVTFPNIADRDA